MKAQAVVCGAGIAGIAAAHALVRDGGMRDVIIVDAGPPLSLTSDKSTECYRNWWPGPGDAMAALSNRSISLMEALANTTGNAIRMDRRGYLYLSANPASVASLAASAHESCALGAGALRVHESSGHGYQPRRGDGFAGQPDGADLILDTAMIHEHFPYLAREVCVALHVRRAGALSAQQLGMLMLEQARAGGARLLTGQLEQVRINDAQLSGVAVRTGEGMLAIDTPVLVDAAGPYLADVARLAGVDLPVACERHAKLTFDERAGVIPRDAPLSIWCDPTQLAWSEDERAALTADADGAALLATFPPGVHGRPVGAGRSMLMYWTYHCPVETPRFPVTWDPHYPEIVLRGMSVMIPGLATYHAHMPGVFVDGGYYTKTRENRPLIGPTPVHGLFLCGAFSGFGIMSAMGAGELLAAHVRGAPLPSYADAFALARYDDPAYCAKLDGLAASGQI